MKTPKGKPKIDSIDQFSVNTWLELDPKFKTLCIELQKSGLLDLLIQSKPYKLLTWGILIRLYATVAQRAASTGSIAGIDEKTLIESLTFLDFPIQKLSPQTEE